MTRPRSSESGFALVTVLVMLFIMLAAGMALLARSDSQQRLSAHERTREASFHVAEAALNAQTLQLARGWPTTVAAPTACDPTSASTSCPQASVISDAYTGKEYDSTCPGATAAPAWTTSVRDNAVGERYWSTAVSSRAAYDVNADGILWVRSTATVRCDRVSVVSLVSRLSAPADFPSAVISANWFATTNQGRKVLVDTLGAYAQPPSIRPTTSAAQPSPIVVRCANLTPAACLSYPPGKGQVQPPAIQTNAAASTTAIPAAQLQSLERQAAAAGSLWTSCPPASTNLSSVGGAPVYIKGPCNVSVGGNTVINSSSTPGVLVIENGTFSIGGTASFYGLLYAANRQNSTGAVISISGNGTIQGVTAVDGPGGVTVGSSNTSLIFDPRAPGLLRGDSGASADKNTFRVLPSQTP